MNQNVNVFAAIVIGLFTSGGFYTVVLFVANWRGRRTEAARLVAAKEKDEADARKAEQEIRNAETARLAMIADMEKRAHDTAEAVAKQQYASLELEYSRVETRCTSCLSELEKMRAEHAAERREHELERREHDTERAQDRRVQDALMDAVAEVIPLLPAGAEQTKVLRAAIRTARRARYSDD